MRGWEQCPKCWGSGLLAFMRPCPLKPPAPLFDVMLRDFDKQPLTEAEKQEFVSAVVGSRNPTEDLVRTIVRFLLKDMKLVPRG